MSITGITEKSRVRLDWKVKSYDFSDEKAREMERTFAAKYGIPSSRVRVYPKFEQLSDIGMDVSADTIESIQDPAYQQNLFMAYIKDHNITDYDFDVIKKIDAEINGMIDYQVYDKYKRYKIKWIEWDNFLSYGAGNRFDFTQLNGMTMLSGTPSNQSGKTTLCIDLIHFLLFGTTTKTDTLDKVFNKFLKDATNVRVEGCIEIDGMDYIIKRTLSRPDIRKRTDKSKTSQKVEYYRVIGKDRESLDEFVESQNEDSSVKTNKAIREAIGTEQDFDLMMSITDSTLDELVRKKDTERGRLLARWIGLMPLEDKDKLAREKFNSEIKSRLLMNMYKKETLENEIEAFKVLTKSLTSENEKYRKENEASSKELEASEKTRDTLMLSKRDINDDVLKIDITTLETTLERKKEIGVAKKTESEAIGKRLAEIGDVEFSVNEYDKLNEQIRSTDKRMTSIKERYYTLKHNIDHLKMSEFCPTCGKKLDNVDNTGKIKELESEKEALEKTGKNTRAELASLTKRLESMKTTRELYTEMTQLTMKKTAIDSNLVSLRSECLEMKKTKTEYEKNKEAIDKNNKINLEIRNLDVRIQGIKNTISTTEAAILKNESVIESNDGEIKKRLDIIEKMKQEEVLVTNWKLYLDMVGKNGISKMVVSKILPALNGKLAELLSDVCDFSVEIHINERNDVNFFISKDGIRSPLSSGSGFELTAAALALRSVISEVSMIPRMNGLVCDEVFGRVSKENYENMKLLMDKISSRYDFVWIISHIAELGDWCNKHVYVRKDNNVSSVVVVNK